MNDTATVLTAAGLEHLRLSFDVWQAVEKCDQLLRRHGMQMIIICEHCHARGDPFPVVRGDNSRHGATLTMTCAHAERRLDFST
jgi:hypothetical protein